MTAPDRLGNPLEVGDTVTFVYAGDYHSMKVTAVDDGAVDRVPSITGSIEVTVPAGSAVLLEKHFVTKAKAKKGSENG